MNIPRRQFLSKIGFAFASAMAAPFNGFSKALNMDPILNIKPLGFTWESADPFLFCVHHEDKFPQGNERMGPPATALKGRSLGDDFIIKDGFRMYHGKSVPGFPGHPHKGFETITIVRQGMVDHADSMGAAGRYGDGDVQWMTAGKGVQHSEMFPLIHQDKENPMELFQIWLNLPKKGKQAPPHFKMMWRDTIPNVALSDATGKKTSIEVIAGSIAGAAAPAPPPNSWAADPKNEVGVWNIKMEAGAVFALPAASAGINRTLYFYEGNGLQLSGQTIPSYSAVQLKPEVPVSLQAGTNTSILILQGRPIGEPVIQYGPFVMNSKEEINQAFEEYHKTQFGGWPWPKYDQVHDRTLGRFAKYADGTEEIKQS